MKKVEIKFRLEDGMSNKYTLMVTSNELGVIKYSHGFNGVAHSVSNLQVGFRHNTELPVVLDEYDSAIELAQRIELIINTDSVFKVDKTLYVKGVGFIDGLDRESWKEFEDDEQFLDIHAELIGSIQKAIEGFGIEIGDELYNSTENEIDLFATKLAEKIIRSKKK